jgi:hypothetical protein
MPQVTLHIPEENIALLLEITEVMGLSKSDVLIKEDSPDWHSQILNERLEKYKSGKTQASSWDRFEKELDAEDEVHGL